MLLFIRLLLLQLLLLFLLPELVLLQECHQGAKNREDVAIARVRR